MRQYNRINILLLLHRGKKIQEIEEFLGVDRTTVWRTKNKYLAQGVHKALEEEDRPGQPLKYTTDQEAELTAMACGSCPKGTKALDGALTDGGPEEQARVRHHQPGISTVGVKKNACKPWLKRMWCIGELTPQYRERMYRLLALYKEAYDASQPVVCLDEKSKQLLKDSRQALSAKPGKAKKVDYEYSRQGTCNIFIAIAPKMAKRVVKVTDRRTKQDFALFVEELVERHFPKARCIQLVLDNLNTHFAGSLVETFGERKARRLLKRIKFIYTPKHASWLNMAEMEISIMDRQCSGGRVESKEKLKADLKAWTKQRNKNKNTIEWKFTRQDADRKLSKHYVS